MADETAVSPGASNPRPADALSTVHLFKGVRRPLRVRGLDRLGAASAQSLSGWPALGTARDDPSSPLDAAIESAPDGFSLIQLTPVYAVSEFAAARDTGLGLLGALVAGYLAQDPALLCFHAAASRTERGLVLMLGATLAGKSTLAAHLIERGLVSFGDDRILLRPDARGGDRAVCLGMPHKLRLPLPGDASPGFAAFVRARRVPSVLDDAQLRFKPGEAATFGATASLAAFLLIERQAGAKATLEAAPAGQVVSELMRQSFAPQLAAAAILAAAVGLAARVPGYRLIYERSAEAAALVAERFGTEAGGNGS